MKLKVLSVGGKALYHERIGRDSFRAANVFTEYDAVVIDPAVVPELWQHVEPLRDGSLVTNVWEDRGVGQGILSLLLRMRRQESAKLLAAGGVVVCYLRAPSRGLSVQLDHRDFSKVAKVHTYTWLPGKVCQWLSDALQVGRGREVRLKDRSHSFAPLFEQFGDKVFFEAYIEQKDVNKGIRVIAEDRVGHPIAFEYVFEAGKIVFVPVFEGVPTKAESDLMLGCIGGCLGAPVQAELPKWLSEYAVPGEDRHAKRITDLESQIAHLSREKEVLLQEQDEAKQFRGILYKRGKYQLEPVIRNALRVLGFDVPEPVEYKEDWDAVVCSAEGKAIGEVEGTQGQVDVTKYRQLLDYVSAQAEKGDNYKGILIGNGYCLQDPPSRGVQFTREALNGCKSQKYCALPITELFKAVCAVLQQPENEELKRQIRLSLLEKTGLYNFDEALASAGSSITKNGVIP